jgi:hypothetical protein
MLASADHAGLELAVPSASLSASIRYGERHVAPLQLLGLCASLGNANELNSLDRVWRFSGGVLKAEVLGETEDQRAAGHRSLNGAVGKAQPAAR